MNIATVLCIDIQDEEAEANAKLIAAAPELLKAAEHFKAYLQGNNPMPKEMLLKFVEKTINKATNSPVLNT